MQKKIILALSAILLIGIAAGAYQYAKKSSSHEDQSKKADITATPVPTPTFASEDEDSPVTDASRPDTMEELHYKRATKISGFVQNKDRFTSDKKMLKDMKGILSRLSPNKLTDPPMPKDGEGMLYGAWTSLDLHDEKGLLYNILLTNLGGGYVVYVGGEDYSFYCDIKAADITRFQNIYRKLCKKYVDPAKAHKESSKPAKNAD